MKIPYSKREGVKRLFVFRRRVPRGFESALGTHWKVALGTSDEREAFEKAAKLVSEQNAQIAEMKESEAALARERSIAAARKGKIAEALDLKLASLFSDRGSSPDVRCLTAPFPREKLIFQKAGFSISSLASRSWRVP
jgi:hypothetical protein